MIWLSADTHFHHGNIIQYAGRPYASVEEMDDTLITNWNARVQPKDTIYFLGDFCFARGNKDDVRKTVANYVRRLNGQIHFVKGNHDEPAEKNKDLFASWCDGYKEINIDGQKLFMSHYAMKVWPASHYGSILAYGHSHGTLPDDPHSLSLDVGVDARNYFPISFDEIKKLMAKKLWKPIDHHGERKEGGGVGLSRDEYAKMQRRTLYLQLKREFE